LKFCPNCGFKLPDEAAKFCPNCGANLAPSVATQPAAVESQMTGQQRNDKAFELLKKELSVRASDLAKNIADSLLEKWKTSGRYPQRLGKIVDELAEKVLPTLIQDELRSTVWQNGELIETSSGQMETSVSASFPVKLETGIPLFGKISIERVRLTMKGTVDISSSSVTKVQVGALELE
jgi:hypothetical protein